MIPAEEKVADLCNSVKLKRKQNVTSLNETPSKTAVDVGEICAKDLISNIFAKVSSVNVNNWFQYGVSSESELNVFEPIQQALSHIDFNLKRNSDFINELTKLLDTSRSIKQEANLKKIAKALESEKTSTPRNSVPCSPAPVKKEERKKSFSLLTLGSKSPKVEKKDSASGVGTSNHDQDLSTSISQIDANLRMHLTLQNSLNNEVNNSNYIELEAEVEKISYHLESLARQWSKIDFSEKYIQIFFFN